MAEEEDILSVVFPDDWDDEIILQLLEYIDSKP